MAISPGTYNFSLQRRADYYFTLQFRDSAGAPIPLNGWTVEAEIWNKARTLKYTDFTITYTNRNTGTVRPSLTDEQTTALPAQVYYDVLLINPEGLREYYLEGVIYVCEGYTA